MSTRSTIWVIGKRWGIHLYREMRTGRVTLEVGRDHHGIVIPLWRYR